MGKNIAIAGVTGAVGQEFLRIIEERKFPFDTLKMLASHRSAGKQIDFMGKTYTVEELTADSFEDVDIALFSAGGGRSKEFAPAAVKAGAVVVDNSSAYRMDPDVPLVVPEVNADAIAQHKGIIANPNCTTIIANVAVYPLHKANSLKRMIVSTYQAASGAGQSAMLEMLQQAKEVLADEPVTCNTLKYQLAFNLYCHDSAIGENGYNEEEMKMVKETHKIFSCPDIAITCTCVRVPVVRTHCESINLEFTNPITPDEVRDILKDAPGVKIIDDRESNRFPMPTDASGHDDVYVGRIRQDESLPGGRGINLWIAGDQIRKGAALNAIQIAELL
ncbi:MAG: aspartate-semialdehyde dehydrogenase [Planctomycetes bacterium]|nr:aspartate-semialdehyde dehydrogenase [Planctomycetota bacterium]